MFLKINLTKREMLSTSHNFKLVFLFLSLFFGSANAQTSTFYDFNTTNQLTNYFNGAGSGVSSVTQAISGGLSNSGSISVPASYVEAIYTTKDAYTIIPVGSTVTFESFIKSTENSGYSGLGFSSQSNASTTAAYPFRPSDALGISVHGGGFIFHNGATDYSGDWNYPNTGGITDVTVSNCSDLINNNTSCGSPDMWFKIVFKIVRATASTFNMRVEVWPCNANGVLYFGSASAIFEVNGVTNTIFSNASQIYNYFSFSGSRVTSFDNFSIQLSGGASLIPAPGINVTPSSLSNFLVCQGSASSSQSVTVSGSGLTANITATAPSGYEISFSSGSGYASTLTLSQSGGSVASTLVYIRLTGSASGSQSGNVSFSSTSVSTQNVAVSGSVCSTPQLTVTSAGETGTSGTNWSISGNTLTVTGIAQIKASVITNHLSSNPLSIQAPSTNFQVDINEAINASVVGNGLTISASNNTANITVSSVITIAGELLVYGGDIIINAALTISSSNAKILLKATNNSILSANLSTNGGDITIWNDSEADGIGGICVNDNVSFDSRTSSDRLASTHTNGGGKITLAGGLDDAGTASGVNALTSGLVANDDFPDGYAVNSGSGSTVSAFVGTPKTGIVLGTLTPGSSPAGHNSNINIFSGGGHIRLHGLVTNNTGATSNDPTGLLFFHGYTINSGTAGNIVLLGNSSVSSIAGAIGMDLAAWRENSYTADGIVQTVNGSINVIARASGGTSYNIAMAIDGTNTNGTKRNIFAATGSGAVSLDGLASGTSPIDIRLTNVDLLSGSGAITLTSRGSSGVHVGGYNIGDGLFIGQKSGSLVTNSSSNISLIADNVQLTKPLNTNSTGALIIESLSNSFVSNITIANQTIAPSHTSLRIGKTTNSANITTGGSAISIAGPISVFGGVVSTNANITTSNASSISLLARSGLRFSASGITVQTGGGAVVLSGDYDANSSGNIITEGALTITTNGGAISMGGGATGSDFAYGIGTSSTIANDQTAGIWVRGAVNLNSGNGDISIRGYAANASPTVQHVPSWGVGLGLGAALNNPASVTINSGIGNILIEGFARNPSGLNTNSFGVVFNNWETTTTESLTITSANTTANAIRLIGNTQNTLQGQRTKNSLRFWSVNNNIRATGIGGGITLSGKTFDGNDHPQICWSGGNLLATSGPIVINTENEALEIGNDMYVGSRSGIAGNTTSSSNVRFSIDDFNVASGIIRVASSGSLTIEPFGSSFTDYTPTTNTILGFTTASRWSLNENAQTLTGLTIGKPLNVSNITIGSTTSIAGPVTIYGGTLAIDGNIESSNGSTISLYGNGLTFGSAITVKSSNGQLIIAPQSTSTTIDIEGATGTLQLPASYFSTNFTNGFSNIQIGSNTQTGNISSNTFTLLDNMTFLTSGSLTLVGKPLMGINNVTLGSAISSINAGESGYFKTTDIGKVFRNVSNSSTFQFPIGNSSYNPVSISNNSGSADNFSVRVIDAVYLNGTSGSVVSTPVVNRTWDISKVNTGSLGVDFVFNWNTGEVANGSLSAPKMNHHTGSVWEIPTVTSTTFATNMLTVVGYTGTFSPFTVAEGASALPVEMVYFYANCTQKDVALNWQTASEHNSDYFQLETSLDGINWEMIQKIAAAGFSQELLNYSAVDQDAARNQKYYRLKQVDFNGEFALYGPLKADCGAASTNIGLHPNPCESHLTLSIDTQIPTELSFTIANPEGVVLETKKMAVQSGITLVTLDVSDYPSGIYILQFEMNDKRFIRKLTVQ